MAERSEFETWQTWLGRRVVVTLQKEPDLREVTGVLLKLSADGEVDVLEDSGRIAYCWPALDVRRVQDDRIPKTTENRA